MRRSSLVEMTGDNNSAADTACMYVWYTYSKSLDQTGKVANPARGQLNREN